MPIRPIDVRRKEFRNGFRGYDANQVDDFLDAVADEFERTYAENSRLREEVSSLRERLQQFEELEGSIREAQARAHQMLAESSARVERIQESYDALQEAKRSFTNDFRQLIKTYADVMENMEISSAREIEASLRERLDTESITVAREAAAHEREYAAPEPEDAGQTSPEPSEEVVAEAASAEDDAVTQHIEPEATAGPTPEEIDSEIAELEATEPEI